MLRKVVRTAIPVILLMSMIDMNSATKNMVSVDAMTLRKNTLLRFSRGYLNDGHLANLLIAQRCELNTLPFHLGLNPDDFDVMLKRHFPGSQFWLSDLPQSALALDRQQLRQQLLALRQHECEELTELLLQYRRHADPSELWLARILASGCFGTGHLWKDLGLSSRHLLRQLLYANFPGVVERNTHDMRWKKFFYRLLCESQGGMLCRVPDCRLCSSFSECFQCP